MNGGHPSFGRGLCPWRVKAGMPLRLLVHRRSFQLKHGAGLVSVPGGRGSAGHTFRDSAVRELARNLEWT